MSNNNALKKREDIKSLFMKGIDSVLPQNLFNKYISLHNNILTINSINYPTNTYDLSHYSSIIVIGAGKAAASMAKALENIIYDKIEKGVIVTKYGFLEKLSKIEIIEAAHPIPDNNSVKAAEKILHLVESAGKDDLIINLISGGASSLLALPVDGISLLDKINTTRILLKKDVTIHEINSVRKCLSKVKGGGLIQNSKSTIISLIISDVIGDDLNVIASGPTYPEIPDYSLAVRLINKYNLADEVPEAVLRYLNESAESLDANRTRKHTDYKNYLLGNNDIAVDEIIKLAKIKGYHTFKIKEKICGEVQNASNKYLNFILSLDKMAKPLCVVSGGETTVNVKGNGKGGRNQHFCLSLIDSIKNYENITCLCGGTDGNDGSTDAAGAVIDNEIIKKAESNKIDYKKYLETNDSYNFFKKLDALVETGPTLTNVMDIQISILT